MRATPFALVFLLLTSAGCDVVSTTYATKAIATKDGQVANGWLPRFIPDSSFDIHTTNDLDVNTSTGSFRFSTSEAAAFSSRLESKTAAVPPFANWIDTVKSMQANGYELRYYTEEGMTWAFFCRFAEGRCEYFMWLQRTRGAAK